MMIVLILIVAYLEKNNIISLPHSQITKISYLSPTPLASSSAVLGENANSLCHAIIMNPSDEQAVLPDPNCTPGVIDPRVTQENIYTTICRSGYTKEVRPPLSYTGSLKRKQIIEYGYTDTDSKHYEEDHFISLELGGSPDDPKNLWPEPHTSMNEKDYVENYLHKQVCRGEITLLEAQQAITTNWYQVYTTQVKK